MKGINNDNKTKMQKQKSKFQIMGCDERVFGIFMSTKNKYRLLLVENSLLCKVLKITRALVTILLKTPTDTLL